MINLELKERERQLKVVQKQIPDVPKLAEETHNLNKALTKEKERVAELAAILENPM